MNSKIIFNAKIIQKRLFFFRIDTTKKNRGEIVILIWVIKRVK